MQWLGIALLPAASYRFSLEVRGATNHRGRRLHVGTLILDKMGASALLGALHLVDREPRPLQPPISHLEPGPLFWAFAAFAIAACSWRWATSGRRGNVA